MRVGTWLSIYSFMLSFPSNIQAHCLRLTKSTPTQALADGELRQLPVPEGNIISHGDLIGTRILERPRPKARICTKGFDVNHLDEE